MRINTKIAALVGAAAIVLAGCSASPEKKDEGNAQSGPKTLKVVTHDSFNMPKEVLAVFEKENNVKVEKVAPGDGGVLVNQLILTKAAPLGDVVFGIDNTFAARAIKEGVIEDYQSKALPEDAKKYQSADTGPLTPIDVGDVCINADKNWYKAKGQAIPASLDDLAKPEYKDQLVVMNPTTSSPGLAFLLATVAAKGESGYEGYWKSLRDNGVKIVKGWEEGYTVDFSGSSGKGPRPLVLSYATSPSAEINKETGESNTVALLDTCFRQVEYAGVLKGAKEPELAKKFVDFLLSDAAQGAFPANMYMYPINKAVKLPEEWAKFAPLAEKPWQVPSTDITSKRETWQRAWTKTVIE